MGIKSLFYIHFIHSIWKCINTIFLCNWVLIMSHPMKPGVEFSTWGTISILKKTLSFREFQNWAFWLRTTHETSRFLSTSVHRTLFCQVISKMAIGGHSWISSRVFLDSLHCISLESWGTTQVETSMQLSSDIGFQTSYVWLGGRIDFSTL